MCSRRITGIILSVIISNNLLSTLHQCNAHMLWNEESIKSIESIPSHPPLPSTSSSSWSLHSRIPMTMTDLDDNETARGPFKKGGKLKVKKKYKKFLLPLLIAYKLKFFALIPLLIGGLLLLTGATGLAGFFFALFAASMGLNKGH